VGNLGESFNLLLLICPVLVLWGAALLAKAWSVRLDVWPLASVLPGSASL
jgi:hypothetical protein